jgi:hypothetical protein
MAAGLGIAAVSAGAPAPASDTLFSFDTVLRVSPWGGPPGDLQVRLDAALRACGQPGLETDHLLGPSTGQAIARLRRCPGYEIEGEAGSRALTVALWTKLWPGVPLPPLAKRIGVLTLTFEATDYDRFLWNVGQPTDPHAYGTWGPFGATLGAGGEIQAIARRIEDMAPGLLAEAFAGAPGERAPVDPATQWRPEFCARAQRPPPHVSGAALLLGLSRPLTQLDEDRLADEFCSDAHHRAWYGAFRTLAARAEVRAAYDEQYAGQNRKVAGRLARLYEERARTPTEVDWAFFLDRGTQFTTDLAAARAALDALPPGASAAQRRLAVSRSSRPSHPAHRRMRVGRDVAYAIDETATADLTEEELAAWTYYGKRRASQVGLSDSRPLAQSPF